MEPITIAMMLGGAALKAHSAGMGRKALNTQAVSPGEIKGYMQPGQQVIGQMQNQYQSMMDPRSAMHRQQYGAMQERSADQMALQNLLARRQSMAMGGSSGMLQQQNRGAMAQNQRDLYSQHQQSLASDRQGAGGLLGNIFKGQMQIQENIGQSALAQREWQREEEMRQLQARQSQMSALGGGLSSAGSAWMQYGQE